MPEKNSTQYNKIRKAIYNFLQQYSTEQELELHKSNKKLKIPTRLTSQFLAWFKDAEKIDFDDPNTDAPWGDVLKEHCPEFDVPAKGTLEYIQIVKGVSLFLVQECTEEELALVKASFRRRIPPRLVSSFVAWFQMARSQNFADHPQETFLPVSVSLKRTANDGELSPRKRTLMESNM